jgi:hypothetical protein
MVADPSLRIFPDTSALVRAYWAPMLLRPVIGSPDQLVVAVAACSQDGHWHVERATSLAALNCFYGDAAELLIASVDAACDGLRDDFAQRGLEALIKPAFQSTAMAIAPHREGAGNSVADIAKRWLADLSSFLSRPLSPPLQIAALVRAEESNGAVEAVQARIYEYVTGRRVGLEPFFREAIRRGRKAQRPKSGGVIIDFSGSKLVANFGELKPGNITVSAGKLKQRLWDLDVNRSREIRGLTREHELLVYARSDPPPERASQIREALQELEEQADVVKIRLHSMSSIELIGNHLLRHEAA